MSNTLHLGKAGVTLADKLREFFVVESTSRQIHV